MYLSPGCGLVEILVEDAQLFFGAEPFNAKVVLLTGPGRSLMGERHRLIIVNGHNEVGVSAREFEFVQMVDGVPEAGTDNDRPCRISLPDHRQSLAQVGIPKRGCELLVWLVEKFKQD